jgi:hypothetical protein
MLEDGNVCKFLIIAAGVVVGFGVAYLVYIFSDLYGRFVH